MSKAPMVLMILDGWGHREDQQDNAIRMAHPQNFYNLWDAYPHTLLECSGNAVGLPRGQMGNSEVGHLNLGAGFVVNQTLTRITLAGDIPVGVDGRASTVIASRWLKAATTPGSVISSAGI